MYIDREKISRAEGYLDALYMVASKTGSRELKYMYDGAFVAIRELGACVTSDDGTHAIGGTEA